MKRKLKSELEAENKYLRSKVKAYDRYRKRVRGIFDNNYGLRQQIKLMQQVNDNLLEVNQKVWFRINELEKEKARRYRLW